MAIQLKKESTARLKTALLTSTLLLSVAAGSALAQQSSEAVETTQSEIDGVQYIVVTAKNYVANGSLTANKSSMPLIETPQSVSVITRDQIDLLNFTDAQQAVRYTAGVAGENYGPDLRFDFFTVRGFTPKQYIDGLPAPISTTIYSVGADLYGFDTVDVLKGPASTLYGNAPPGGLYNQTSRRASDTFSGEVRGKYGTDDFAEVAGTVTGPLIADRLNGRVTA
ncbi:MAG: TonB-dependent receptor plug domain-containing protein, partial [Rhodospirillaceae bacterium]|nr:TonB-dependent receptor plug domain-containing protein [Rhodospirillaceae bacterium]